MRFSRSQQLLARVRTGGHLTSGEQARLALLLALPAIISQLVTIVMEYLDTAMVGHLGAAASASIGIVSTTTWLMGGLCSSLAGGFAVLVAQSIGAQDMRRARIVLRKAVRFTLLTSTAIGAAGAAISPWLPQWLGGGPEIQHDATVYFFVFAVSIPVWELNFLMAGMLRSAGNTLMPSVVNVAACLLDVAFNYVFIFVLRMGVAGAALGTLCAMGISATALTVYTLCFSPELHLTGTGKETTEADGTIVREALQIGVPMAVQHVAMCSAHIVSTVIVAPLGTTAIAAHAFGITIEGLCYMPGYGIGDAATTLAGQTIGARRADLQRSFARITLGLGVGFMTFMGMLMYAGVPWLMPLMTPDAAVQALTVECLRIEAFAEPLYAASIVAYSLFVGAGDTRVPAALNLGSMWVVRLPLAWLLAQSIGLRGVWAAMCAELCFRGIIFVIRLYKKKAI
ncbi:MAG: MATE family efflux transporter [Paludibacteraceae bacterium]|nr:MATE family efflux transporter [Paludibacteraceae bacterium]